MRRRGSMLAIAIALLTSAAVLADEPTLSPAELRGRVIYTTGTTDDGREISARIGENGFEIGAAAMPCVQCHGRDGRGRPEGGVSPTDLTWSHLTTPYGLTHPSGREHGPYDDDRLVQAIAMGFDPAGTPLHVAMPRYRLTRDDMADLIAYIKRLDSDPDPGVTDETIVVGTLQPTEGRLAGLGRTIRATLEDLFGEINREGGVFGRRLELRVVEAPPTAAGRTEALRAALDDQRMFAMVANFLAGGEAEQTALLRAAEVPLIGPFTLHPDTGVPLNPYVFYLLPGLEDQARALFDQTAAVAESPARLAVVYPVEQQLDDTARAFTEQAGRAEWNARAIAYRSGELRAEALVQELRADDIDELFVLGGQQERLALLEAADRLGWYPEVLLLGSLAGTEVLAAPRGFEDRIRMLLALPPFVTDGERRLSAVQAATLAAGRVLVEALERTGRDLDRTRLMEVLEGFYEFDTGVAPPVTFGPNRRIGTRVTALVRIDLANKRFVRIRDTRP